MYCENVNHEEFEGFDIYLDFCEEYAQPDWDMTENEKTELLRKIENSELLWFCARVRACKNDIKLATVYLGHCCYVSKEEFMQKGEYYEDMKEQAVSEAKEVLLKLVA